MARLRETGAVILGKTTTPEYSLEGRDRLRPARRHRQPVGPRPDAGGLSGGSATAVGLGMGPWSVGTDGGGSVRIPAAFTGTVALKPTYGLIPLYPPSPFGTLSHAGPMTRTVRDAAALLDVITGFDPRDWSAMPTPATSFLDGLDDGVAGLRVAYSPKLGFGRNDPEVDAAVRAAVGYSRMPGASRRGRSGFARSGGRLQRAVVLRRRPRCSSVLRQGRRQRVDPGLQRASSRVDGTPRPTTWTRRPCGWTSGARMGAFHTATTCCSRRRCRSRRSRPARTCRTAGRRRTGRAGRRTPTRST